MLFSRFTLLLVIVFLVSACGGGNSSDNTSGEITTGNALRYLIAVNSADSSISSYAVSEDTGRLYYVDRTETGTWPVDVVVHPNQRFVYSVDGAGDSISQFSISGEGKLTMLAPSPVDVIEAQSAVIDTLGKNLYATNCSVAGEIYQFSISSDGTLAPLGDTPIISSGGSCPDDILIHPSGKRVYTLHQSSGGIAYFDRAADGTLTATGLPVDSGTAPVALVITSSGNYAFSLDSTTSLIHRFRINTDYSFTEIGTFQVNNSASDLELSHDDSVLYVLDLGDGYTALYSVGTDGSLTAHPGGDFSHAGRSPTALAISRDRQHAFQAYFDSKDIGMLNVSTDGSLSSLDVQPIPAFSSALALALVYGGTAPKSVPQYLYAAESSSNYLHQFNIAATGELTTKTPATVTSANTPWDIVADPAGRFLYAANWMTNNIAQFTLEDTGLLSPMLPATVIPEGTNTLGIAIGPLGRYVYALSMGDAGGGTITPYKVNVTGSLTNLNAPVTTGVGANNITVHPSGSHVYITHTTDPNVYQYEVFVNGTLASAANPVSIGSGQQDIKIHPSGNYAYVIAANTIYQFNVIDGILQATGMTSTATGLTPYSIAIHPNGNHVYVANNLSGTISQYHVNDNGSLTVMNPAGVDAGGNNISVTHISIDDSGRFVYVSVQNLDTILQYEVRADGTLSPLATATTPAAPAAKGIAIVNRWQ
ncbi:MAG: beta-propeller fold lactonase family protein [Gammaproteobacteria bacterium]|nr:beta-propeller fold lactonase family protein [Gammaproteobacteria bacterium]MDH5802228.1 beta-propeller fold lactonase family protein [Gammaproteobacteria bacterium]